MKYMRQASLIGKNPFSIMDLGILYRITSLLLTSLFFFLGSASSFVFKLGLVVTLGIAAWIITDLQRRYIKNTKILQAIVLTETIGLTLLLIPTGGISSPFIWYAFNPVLVAAFFLTPLFCWGALTFYLGSATFIAYRLIDIDNIVMIFEGKSYFYLVCLLTTLLARLFSRLTRELNSKAALLNRQQDELIQVNEKLTETNQKYQEALEQIMLERIYMDQMIISEEQNRIANEIHDSVSQRLFGIVYSLHSLQAKSNSMTREELNKEYQFLSQSANTTIKELRAAIYRLSSVKKGEQPFLLRLKKYLDEYARLNDIRIDYRITGDEFFISNEQKEALYRIICEACGNAVRHGKCTIVDLKLSLLDEKTVVFIQDDGIGISSYVDKKEQGIGLINMQNSVSSFNGTFSIEGILGSGTTIIIEIPSTKIMKKQEVAG